MQATAAVRWNDQHVVVTLDAVELSENRILREFSEPPRVTTRAGEEYLLETINILCISAMRFARRKLGIPNGLAITVLKMSGVVDRDAEVGICDATMIAIARSLNKSPELLLTDMEDWQVTD